MGYKTPRRKKLKPGDANYHLSPEYHKQKNRYKSASAQKALLKKTKGWLGGM